MDDLVIIEIPPRFRWLVLSISPHMPWRHTSPDVDRGLTPLTHNFSPQEERLNHLPPVRVANGPSGGYGLASGAKSIDDQRPA